MALDKLDPHFNMSSLMVAYHVSVVHHSEEVKPNTHEYTFIASMGLGRTGRDGCGFVSHGATPELAVHNVVEYYRLMNNNVGGDLPTDLIQAHVLREVEARRLLDSSGPYGDLGLFGRWIDQVTGVPNKSHRSISRVAGRALEEMVEVCLAAGLGYGQVMNHVADAWHNQCLKDSAKWDRTTWPSELREPVISHQEVIGEIADLRLTVLDLMWLVGATEQTVNEAMLNKFLKLKMAHAEDRLKITPDHTFYIKKGHVK